MNEANALPVPPRANRLSAEIVLDAWRGVTRRQLATTFFLGVALFAYHIPTGLAAGEGPLFASFVFVADQIKAFALLLAFLVADRVTGRDPVHRGPYVFAILCGATVGGVLAVTWTSNLVAMLIRPAQARVQFMAYIGLEMVLLGAAVFWVINDRRRARRARARMHGAELERIAAERRSIESDLQAMQARVEPQFLFNTLAQVKRLYAEDLALGERMLDELIAYLRAAMPRMRDTSSGVVQELELARAYLEIVKVPLGGRLTYVIDSIPADGDARMPPMMMLPLVDHAVGRARAAPQSHMAIHIQVASSVRTLQLEIAVDAPTRPDNDVEVITGIRERLRALFGADASLVVAQRDGGATAWLLTLPFQPLPAPVAAGDDPDRAAPAPPT